jgi:hypothetical protein
MRPQEDFEMQRIMTAVLLCLSFEIVSESNYASAADDGDKEATPIATQVGISGLHYNGRRGEIVGMPRCLPSCSGCGLTGCADSSIASRKSLIADFAAGATFDSKHSRMIDLVRAAWVELSDGWVIRVEPETLLYNAGFRTDDVIIGVGKTKSLVARDDPARLIESGIAADGRVVLRIRHFGEVPKAERLLNTGSSHWLRLPNIPYADREVILVAPDRQVIPVPPK